LKTDGTVWAWGDNYSGQLGDGTTTERRTPVQVSGLTDVIAVTGGEGHGLALRADGTLWAWGDNYSGQLGDGTTTERRTPVQVSGLTDVIAVAAGGYHSLAVKTDGTLWTWGDNWSGQLGDGTTTERITPVQILGLTDVIAIAAGWEHSLALKSDGTVWAWGLNDEGRLGDGTSDGRTSPVQVKGEGGVGYLNLLFHPQNSAPYPPDHPSPADGATHVPLETTEGGSQVTLGWPVGEGGADPDPWDTVTYDVYFGASAENLSITSAGLTGTSATVSGLSEETTYYWQVVARDASGLTSAGPVWHFTTWRPEPDSSPPQLLDTDPDDGAMLQQVNQIIFSLSDDQDAINSGVDDAAVSGTITVTDSGGQPVSGTISESDDQFTFTPDVSSFLNDTYRVSFTAIDMAGNSQVHTFSFTVDSEPPPAPVVNPVTSPTHNPSQAVSGTKESYTAILVAGEEVVGHTAETTWQHTVSLTAGTNQFLFSAKDRAGNESETVSVEIVFDDIAPLPVDTLTLNVEGIGTTVALDWTDYDESFHGDVASYRIYWEISPFSGLSLLTPKAKVPAGTFTYTAEGLSRKTPYWFAVVAVDVAGNAQSSANPVTGVPTDAVPPEDPTNLGVVSYETGLLFTWTPSANRSGDLSGYKVYFNEATEGASLPSSQNSHEQTGLAPASAYPFRITAYDADNNESTGVSVTGYTWLLNPANLTVTPRDGYVDLSWDGVAPAAHLKHYQVYVSETDYNTVEGMTPNITTGATSAKVAGLTNSVTYYFAVTAVNLSGGQGSTVSTVQGTPVPDTEGPEMANVQVDGVALTQGHRIEKPATFTLNASDPAGVSRVEFSFDGVLLRTDYNGTPHYDAYWKVVSVDDGSHTLTLVVFDTLGNSTTLEYSLVVALAAPAAPTITQPQTGIATNTATITISGHAEKYTEIILYDNSVQAGDPVAVDPLGNFSVSLTLTEGANHIQAAARNRAGLSPLSTEVVVTLDATIPPSPENLRAEALQGGLIRLTWRAPADTAVKGYNLYRAESGFTSILEATRVNTELITNTIFDDLPAQDGTYHYRITTLSTVENESALSQEVSAESDRTAPRLRSVRYTPQGNYDPQSGRMAPGTVDVLLTLSEPLQSTPFFSITPEGGVPFSIELTKVSDLEYAGFFVISESTPTGAAYAVFSGRDLVGNRGTEIDAGGAIQIDTDGPAVSRIAIDPPEPIQNDQAGPVTVDVTIGLTEQMKPGEAPELSYLLSGQGRTPIPITALTQVTPRAGEAQAWHGSFTLPADAGLREAETLGFIYRGTDDLDNVSGLILCPNLFQVYQGELPPLETPGGLTGESLSGGRIRLSWNEVQGAAGYKLYRQAPGETELTEYQSLGTVLQYTDVPALEGKYTYAIASIRRDNNQESVSGMSGPVDVDSDATGPGAPLNLFLELVPHGIMAAWDAPPHTEPITYSIYRSDLPQITSVEGLTPFATGITQSMVIDPNPSPTDHAYVVTAVDGAGNESAPSNSFYLNFDLLPVSSLSVVQKDTAPPVVSWTHPGGGIAGYDIYVGAAESLVKLNDVLLTALSYTDTGYAGDERRYTVVAVDSNGVESVGRSITLPLLMATLTEGASLKRGIMNRLEYQVENLGAAQVDQIRLRVDVEARDHMSEAFSLEPSAPTVIPVVVGGYDDLPDVAALATTIQVTPNEGEKVEIIRSGRILVSDGMLVLQILNEEFTRGGTGKIWFTLENTGEEEIEILTAKNSGNAASDEVTFYLVDQDDNVLSTLPFKQALGQDIVTLSNGDTVARIPAGGIFTSDAVHIPVPANAPDDVVVRLVVSRIHFHLGGAGQVTMDGLSPTHQVTLVDTSYYGEILTITPQSSKGDEDILITGRGVERATGLPMPQVPLDLVITVKGFDRTYRVFTDGNGDFSYTFTPLAGESGIYRVRAMHPDVLDRPVQGQFVINRVSINPSSINLSIPTNYERTIDIQVSTAEGTGVNNLELVYEEADQPGGVFPEGVHLSLGAPVAYLGSGGSAILSFNIWADNRAAETGSLLLKVRSDESAPDAWGSVRVNTHFSQARPVLYFTPDHLETGLALDETVTETLILENRGLADMNDVSLSLVLPDGTPAPDWVYLNTPSSLGTMAVGERQEVSIAFSPTTAQVSEGMHEFKLRVSSASYPRTDINLYVSVTLSGLGNALFKVTDIYTGTLDENNQPIQGLAGARVYVQNEEVTTVEDTRYTDSAGEAYFVDLPAGRYKYRVTADNHQEHIGRIWVKPGITLNEEVFLDYDLVTVEWEVNEITIEDRYEIILTATYETDVPAAVVVAEPTSITLPKMKAGDVYNGEFTLTNYGLIRADDLVVTLPHDDENFKFELLGGLPESIEAKARITVPYRVTALTSLEHEEGGTGGGCYTLVKCAVIDYDYTCANGVLSRASTQTCWTYSYGECGVSAGAPVITSRTWNIGGRTGGGSVSSPAPAPEQIEGVKCFPPPFRKEADCDPCRVAMNESLQNRSLPTSSSVHTFLREYQRDDIDLTLKVPGGTLSVERRFYGNQWHWEHTRNNLKFIWDSLGNHIEALDKGGVIYERSSVAGNVYIHDVYRITETVDGYRWEDKNGNWKEYDATGRMTSYGSRTGVVGRLLYEAGDGERLTGIADRNDTQVIWYEYNPEGDISAAYDLENRRVEYTYTNGNLGTVKDVLGNVTTFEYDTAGRIIKVIDAALREHTITYEEYGNVASVLGSDGRGHFFEFDYDEAKKETYARITTSGGMIKEIWYDREGETRRIDVNGRTIQSIVKDGRDLIITDERGNVTRKEFDEWDNLTKVIYPDGSIVSYEYEHTFNRRVKETNENGIVTRYEYDSAGNLTRKTEAVGTPDERVTQYTYDGDGNRLTIRVLADANTVESLTTMEYDASGNMTSVSDPEGHITRFTSHDIMGNMLTKVDARGKPWTYEYDAAGRLKTITDPLGNVTRLFYDEVGNKIREVDAELKEKTYEYGERNNLVRSTDGAGNTTLFEYDSDGKLTRQTDAEGKMIYYQYDTEGRLVKTIDGNGNEIAMEYDDTSGPGCASCSGGGPNQPSRITYPTFSKEYVYDLRGRKIEERDVLSDTEAYITTFTYDQAGNLASKTDKEANTTYYQYDGLNRLIKVIDPLGQETQYTYDDRDNLIQLTDARGNTTHFEYDRNNRLVKEIRPMGEETTYQYDGVGNLIQKTDAKNQKTGYLYDDAGRLVEIKYYGTDDHVNPVKTVRFTYDRVGNLKTYDDGTTSARYGYDDAYRKISESVYYGAFTLSYAYTYYKNGLKETFTGPDNVTYTYSYDGNNQLTGVEIPGKGFITYTSYTWNRPAAITLPGGSTKGYTYDPLMRVKEITAKDPAQNILMTFRYDYDKVDNILNKDTEHGNYEYQYDDLYRLTSADNPVLADEIYTYDPVGNRLISADFPGEWSYNQNNELLGYDGIAFVYDDNGNMVRKTENGRVVNGRDKVSQKWSFKNEPL